MPVKYKNNKTREMIERKDGFYYCKICGKEISPETTKNIYCLECSLKYSKQQKTQILINKKRNMRRM